MSSATANRRSAAQQQRRARRRKLAAWVAATSTAAFAAFAGLLGWQLATGNDPSRGASVPAPLASPDVTELPAPLVTKTS